MMTRPLSPRRAPLTWLLQFTIHQPPAKRTDGRFPSFGWWQGHFPPAERPWRGCYSSRSISGSIVAFITPSPCQTTVSSQWHHMLSRRLVSRTAFELPGLSVWLAVVVRIFGLEW
jgi:hypothetical protein